MDYIYKDYKLDLSGNPFRTEYSDEDYAANKTTLDNTLKSIFASVGLILDTTNIYNAKIAYQYTNEGPRLEWKGDLYLQKNQPGIDGLKWKNKQAGYQSTMQIVNNTIYLNNGSGGYSDAAWRWLNLFEITELLNPEYAYLKNNFPYFKGIWEYMELRDQDATLTDSNKEDDNRIFQLSQEKEQSWNKGSRWNNFSHYAIPNYHIIANGTQQRINGLGFLPNKSIEKDNSFQYSTKPNGLLSNKEKTMQLIDRKPELWYNNFSDYNFTNGSSSVTTDDENIYFRRNGQIEKQDTLDSGEYYIITCRMTRASIDASSPYATLTEKSESTYYNRQYNATNTVLDINFDAEWTFVTQQLLPNNQMTSDISLKANLILQSYYSTGLTSSTEPLFARTINTLGNYYCYPMQINMYVFFTRFIFSQTHKNNVPYIKIGNDTYQFNPFYANIAEVSASNSWTMYYIENEDTYHFNPESVSMTIKMNCSHPSIEQKSFVGGGVRLPVGYPSPIEEDYLLPVYLIPFINIGTGSPYHSGYPYIIVKLKKTS